MSLTRLVARPLLASIFIADGWDSIRHPEGKASTVDTLPLVQPKGGSVVGDDTLTLVRLNGFVQFGGGVLLAIGKAPRLASLALIGSIVPTTYAGYRFWEEPDEDTRAQQRVQLLKNLGLLGGLILAAVDTEGAPSVGWRTRRRVNQMASAVTVGRAVADGQVHQSKVRAADASKRAGRHAKRAATVAARQANAAAGGPARHAGELASDAAKTGVTLASPYLRHVNASALEATEEALEVAGPLISAGIERAEEFIGGAIDVASPLISVGLERAGELLTRVADHPSGGG